jgi:hypothetical protein
MMTRNFLMSGCVALSLVYSSVALADTPAPAKSAQPKPAKTDSEKLSEFRKDTAAKDTARNQRDRSVFEALRDEFKAGKISKEDFKAKVAKLHDSIAERRKIEAARNKQEWGELVERTEVHTEMQDHARRIAYLDRALVVAETEVKDAEQAKLVARINALRDKENARHQAALEKFRAALKPAAPAPSAGTPAPAVSAKGVAK